MKIDVTHTASPHPLTADVSEVAPAHLPSGRVAVVASCYNGEIVEALIGGAIDEIHRAGVGSDSILLLRVPGAFEIPQTVNQLLASRSDLVAVVTIGCVIRGETPHFDYVCQTCADGVAHIARTQSVPLTLGVLTCDTLEQAQARSRDDGHNKGREAARTALNLAGLFAAVSTVPGGSS